MFKLLKVALAEHSEPEQSVTYDDGEGKKDLVVMTGPLSKIYTQALNVYFAKTDVNESDSEKNPEEESVSVATESAMIDAVITAALKDKLADDVAAPLDNYNFVSDRDDLNRNPNVVIFTTDAASARNPEVLDAAEIENTRFEDTDKDWIMFIGPSTNGDGKLETKFADFDDIEETNAFNAGDQFKRATESLYASRGISVVIGFENLFQTLLERSKTK